jgi:hypothetical protein
MAQFRTLARASQERAGFTGLTGPKRSSAMQNKHNDDAEHFYYLEG